MKINKLKKLLNSLMLILLMCCACTNHPEKVTIDSNGKKWKAKSDIEVEAYVMLIPNNTDKISAGIRITDETLIDDLILSPINDSKIDHDPAAYIVLGSISLKHRDGSMSYFTLYLPWGHISKDKEYYIADLSKLKATMKKALDVKHQMFFPDE
jgi:hypothetical protein